ncbi:hypothetical protein GCM10011408_28530 [Dyella caseinilytica]|nr:hypothetical protein GCM10011408_28530 [Dyella caseinilytica]
MELNAAIDIETLDRAPTAVVLSIGCAVFNRAGGILGTFHRVLSKLEQHRVGRTVGVDTLAWWKEQDEQARVLLTTPGDSVSGALHDLRHFLDSHAVAGVYGYGADFDNATVRSLAQTFGVDEPWHYRKNRCGRTVVALAGDRIALPERVGTHHNALDDAIFQARHIAAALNALNTEN